MATEGPPTSDAPGNATPPARGALALLVASAVGGLIGSRVGAGKQLAVAAGATALAWLSLRKQESAALAQQPPSAAVPRPTEAEREPEPQPEMANTAPPDIVIAAPLPDPRIEDWLARQMEREQHAAALENVVEMPAAEVPVQGMSDLARLIPEDDYTPESLLLENFDEEPEWRSEAFMGLSEPVVRPVASPPPPVISAPLVTDPFVATPLTAGPPPESEARPVFAAPPKAAPEFAGGFEHGVNPWGAFPQAPVAPTMAPIYAAPPARVMAQVYTAPPAPAIAPVYAAPIPEIEPLPSWNEPMGLPSEAPLAASGVELESIFTSPVFEGATLPDEIQVAPTSVPTPVSMQGDPMAALFKEYEPAAPPAMPADLRNELSSVPEIDVHIAAPGDAWFDSPLAGIPNPWGPPAEDPEMESPAPSNPVQPPSAPKAIVDAEIVLRPRAPFQASVVPKVSSPAPESAEPELVAKTEDDGLPSAPVKAPGEQRARATWRSWWRGD